MPIDDTSIVFMATAVFVAIAVYESHQKQRAWPLVVAMFACVTIAIWFGYFG
jgi:hypothetical protein